MFVFNLKNRDSLEWFINPLKCCRGSTGRQQSHRQRYDFHRVVIWSVRQQPPNSRSVRRRHPSGSQVSGNRAKSCIRFRGLVHFRDSLRTIDCFNSLVKSQNRDSQQSFMHILHSWTWTGSSRSHLKSGDIRRRLCKNDRYPRIGGLHKFIERKVS